LDFDRFFEIFLPQCSKRPQSVTPKDKIAMNTSSHWLKPITLEGNHVRLEPLSQEHSAALGQAACDGELWKLWYTSVPTPEQTGEYIEKALESQQRGESSAFVVRHLASKEIVGCTRYYDIVPHNKRLAIGYTWYAQRVQRSAVNTECKLLLLGHAFETLQCIAVEFHTHWHNHASRQAIARLGAKQDGVLRQHMIMPDGSLRDTAVFSILDSEWSAVRRNLTAKLERHC
jgi:RimJ/RimL family protein N-acetyltransferase